MGAAARTAFAASFAEKVAATSVEISETVFDDW
jgi:hypothetical protein